MVIVPLTALSSAMRHQGLVQEEVKQLEVSGTTLDLVQAHLALLASEELLQAVEVAEVVGGGVEGEAAILLEAEAARVTPTLLTPSPPTLKASNLATVRCTFPLLVKLV